MRAASGRSPSFVRVTASGAAIYDLGAPLGHGASGILARLRMIPGVASVEPDLTVTTGTIPADGSEAAAIWGLLGASEGVPHGIDALGAWSTTRGLTIPGRHPVVVAVIDTGILWGDGRTRGATGEHPDLAGQTVAGYDMISDASLAGDGNGRDDFPGDPGDWCTDTGQDSDWHGTHVAGTIAAIADNGQGVFGGAPDVRIQPVRVLGHCFGYTSDVADAVRWASGGSVPGIPANATPARVLNLSLGGEGACEPEMAAAIAVARANGAVVVAAAGNDAIDAAGFSPANCPGAFSVAATTRGGHRAYFSDYGSTVDVAAPGVAIMSTVDEGITVPSAPGYALYDGTSMATPHVAVVAALIAAASPGRTPAEIEAILRASATTFPASPTDLCARGSCGAGVVNAARALAALGDGDPPLGDFAFAGLSSTAPETPDPVVTIVATADDPQSGVATIEVSGDGTSWRSGDAAARVSWNLADPAYGGSLAPGPRSVYVRWRNGAGRTSIPVAHTIDYLAGPVATVDPIQAWSTTTALRVAWAATPRIAGAAILDFSVRYRRARWNGGFGARVTWLASTPAGSGTFHGLPGFTYCFSVMARDSRGVESTWTSETCTALPLDDRSLVRGGTWSAGRAGAYFGGTFLRSNAHGARLVRAGIVARRIALLATACPGCGKVAVTWNGALLRTVNLDAATVRHRVFTVGSFAPGRAGTLRIEIISKGRRVIVDGILVSRT